MELVEELVRQHAAGQPLRGAGRVPAGGLPGGVVGRVGEEGRKLVLCLRQSPQAK